MRRPAPVPNANESRSSTTSEYPDSRLPKCASQCQSSADAQILTQTVVALRCPRPDIAVARYTEP